MYKVDIPALVAAQREFFSTGKTLSVEFRRRQLVALKQQINRYESHIMQALHNDLGKCGFESYATEIGIVQAELSFMLKHVRSWAKPRRVRTPLTSFGSVSHVCPEPYGCVLVLSPWNYPFQLALVPLAAAICAGNCVVLKPSSSSAATTAVIAEMLRELFPPEYVAVVAEGHSVHDVLLAQKFDYIFFTGSVGVGKTVMAAAARNLTPVCLELGGKSPCIVDKSANVEVAARRIIWGKLLNAGQTCVAPDYVLVHSDVKDALVAAMRRYIVQFYGTNPLAPESILPSIINQRHFLRLQALCDGSDSANGTVLRGTPEAASPDAAGIDSPEAFDVLSRRIAPVILDEPKPDSPVMRDEIFGPILPVISVQNMDEAVAFVSARPEPLALYLFTTDKAVENAVVGKVRYGGGCVNDVVMHLTSPYMAFGGVGDSGIGSYHGKAGFDTFTHYKSVLKSPSGRDLPFRYPPYKNRLKLAKFLLGGSKNISF